MVEIGGRPILWHIMMHYSHFGFHEFAVALGYKGEYIKKYMIDFWLSIEISWSIFHPVPSMRHPGNKQPWKVDLIDTGAEHA